MDPTQRIERDSMGEVLVPASARYGAQTARALANFPISGRPLPREVVHALGVLKAAAAAVHGRAGRLEPQVAAAIEQAALEVASGQHDAQFPVDVFQTGSGTSSHMNANEVIANLATAALAAAGRPFAVHANDHVNLAQSSNDVFPSAIRLALLAIGRDRLQPAIAALAAALHDFADRTFDVVKNGRTHLMDAMPIRCGQVFRGYADQVDAGAQRLAAAFAGLAALPIGGTAVGTGVNAPPDFGAEVAAVVAARTGLPVATTTSPFAAQSSLDDLVHASAAMRTFATALYKVTNDVRWLASSAIGELRLPALQPGSSMMPGKVNPVVNEAVLMVCAHVLGLDATVAFANTQGQFELNTMLPLVAQATVESAALLASACMVLRERCVLGASVTAVAAARVAHNAMLATALTGRIGYAAAAAIAAEAEASGRTVAEVARERTALTAQQLEQLLAPERLAGERGRSR